MTINEAHKMCRDYYDLSNPTEEDDFLLTEALSFLISETHDGRLMTGILEDFSGQLGRQGKSSGATVNINRIGCESHSCSP